MKAKIKNRFHQLEAVMRQNQTDINNLARLMEMNRQAIIKLENESEQRFEALEEWSSGADEMLTELNHALPDPEYDAKCEAASDVEASLDRHRERLGLNKPTLKQLDQSVFDGLDEKWQWATVSSIGMPFVYSYKPAGNKARFSDSTTQEMISAGKVMRVDEYDYDATNWQNSLIERESKELTGSDLCRAMLARGDKYVLCFVSDFSDDYAVNQSKMINLVTHAKGNSIFAKSARWKYAVPINQQTGEPLTASEVGL